MPSKKTDFCRLFFLRLSIISIIIAYPAVLASPVTTNGASHNYFIVNGDSHSLYQRYMANTALLVNSDRREISRILAEQNKIIFSLSQLPKSESLPYMLKVVDHHLVALGKSGPSTRMASSSSQSRAIIFALCTYNIENVDVRKRVRLLISNTNIPSSDKTPANAIIAGYEIGKIDPKEDRSKKKRCSIVLENLVGNMSSDEIAQRADVIYKIAELLYKMENADRSFPIKSLYDTANTPAKQYACKAVELIYYSSAYNAQRYPSAMKSGSQRVEAICHEWLKNNTQQIEDAKRMYEFRGYYKYDVIGDLLRRYAYFHSNSRVAKLLKEAGVTPEPPQRM